MAFSVLGFALASSLTRDLEDRERASGLNLLGGLLGSSPLGLVLVASAAGDGGGTAGAEAGPTRVQVPPVEASAAKGELALNASGLNSAVVKVGAAKPIDTVLGSDPAAGTVVDLGSTVTILVSAGVKVPDVVGMKEPDATAILESVGLIASVKRVTDAGDADVVLKMEPPAGAHVEPASTVTLEVSVSTTAAALEAVTPVSTGAKTKSSGSRT